jgi:hypothetical protein
MTITHESCAPTCVLCGDTGFVFVPGDSKRVTRCECRTSDLKLRSILPPLFQPARLSDFTRPLMDAGQRWLAEPTSGLLLTGPTGTGKSWFAAGLVRALVEAGNKVTFSCASDFYAAIRASFNTDVSELTVLSQFTDVPFLAFDDLGAGGLSDFERRAVLGVLDRRLNFLRPSIVTSNLSVELIAEKLDERIASRLSGFTRIVMTGRDRRART